MTISPKTKAWLSVGKTLALLVTGYMASDTGAVKFNMPQAQASTQQSWKNPDAIDMPIKDVKTVWEKE